MTGCHPLAELAPRDVVSLAIAAQMARTQHPSVYLDLSHLDAERIRRRFPGIDRLCRNFDLDITRDPIPVCPGAHYMIGGVTIDPSGRTTVPGLWAAGEVTSSGLHGANRLASNSLLEGLVFGSRVAEDVIAGLEAAGPRPLEVPPLSVPPIQDHQAGIDLVDLRESLRALMWRRVGITRDEAGLKEASDRVEHWGRYILPLEFDDVSGWTMQNMLLVARLMITAASLRRESRGVHYRRDHPKTDPAMNHHISLRAIAPDPHEIAARRDPHRAANESPDASPARDRPHP